jgi:hypothetical protein
MWRRIREGDWEMEKGSFNFYFCYLNLIATTDSGVTCVILTVLKIKYLIKC